MRNRILSAAAMCLTVLLAASVVACRTAEKIERTSDAAAPASSASDSATAGEPAATGDTSVLLYFNRGEVLGVGGRDVTAGLDTEALAQAAVKALLDGPNAQESEFGLGTTVPTGTRLLGVKIEGAHATIDLSGEFAAGGGSLSMMLRAAQIVHTATQWPAIRDVEITIDGERIDGLGGEGVMVGPAVTRADFESVVPAILVERPYCAAEVRSPVTVSGSSNVFEAVHTLNVTDVEGGIVTEKTVTASSGTGTRGTWSAESEFTTPRDGLGAIIVWANSPKDGARTDLVEVPVWMKK